MMKLIREFRQRWIAKTPAFWREMQKILLAISFVAGVGLSQIEQLPKWDWLDDALRIGVFSGLFGMFLAQLTKEDSEEQSNTIPKVEPKDLPLN